eukprot:TRINITY_DN651_c0_g1_i1.p1 TRINITY_DN651_c0_g1~~TRINITY_DN651_c0_g1_i1.p1  ORF type:complete len:560 (+),score=70.69 TRINITY_DN651_c0_g1_i1:135-1814(+)
MAATEEHQPVKGVVIISLPPPDNPSEGKTICAAFTVGGETTRTPYQPHHNAQQLARPSRREVANILSVRSWYNRMSLGLNRSTAFAIIAAMAIVLAVWICIPHHGGSITSHENKEDSENLWVYALYSKYGGSSAFTQTYSPRLKFLIERDMKRNNMVLSSTGSRDSIGFVMKGNTYPSGLYYVSMLVGDPPRPYHIDVDTGSGLTWLQCDAPCRSCAKGPHPLYKPRRKNLVSCMDPLCKDIQAGKINGYECSSASVQCDYEIGYADHGFSMGVLVRDAIRALITNGSLVQTNFVFGCAYDQQGPLASSPSMTDGLLGLSNAQVSLPSQLAKQGIIKNVIGHCISRNETGGGYLFFGNDLKPVEGLTWVPMQGRPSMKLYNVGTPTMKHGSRSLLGNGVDKSLGNVIFDTGSSFTYLSKQAYNAFVSAVKEGIFQKGFVEDPLDSTLPVCWSWDHSVSFIEEVAQYFSPLVLDFGKNPWLIKTRQFRIYPEDYLVRSAKGNVCLGILDGGNVSDGNINIIGDNSLQGHLVIYDNVENSVGWVRTDCRKPPSKFKALQFI